MNILAKVVFKHICLFFKNNPMVDRTLHVLFWLLYFIIIFVLYCYYHEATMQDLSDISKIINYFINITVCCRNS